MNHRRKNLKQLLHNSNFFTLIQNNESAQKTGLPIALMWRVHGLCQHAENTLMSSLYKYCPELHVESPFAIVLVHLIAILLFSPHFMLLF